MVAEGRVKLIAECGNFPIQYPYNKPSIFSDVSKL